MLYDSSEVIGLKVRMVLEEEHGEWTKDDGEVVKTTNTESSCGFLMRKVSVLFLKHQQRKPNKKLLPLLLKLMMRFHGNHSRKD